MEHRTRIRWRLVGLTVALAGAILTLPSRPAMADVPTSAQLAFSYLDRGASGGSRVTEYVGVRLKGNQTVDFDASHITFTTGVLLQLMVKFQGNSTRVDETYSPNTTFSISPTPAETGSPFGSGTYRLGLADAGKIFTITGSYTESGRTVTATRTVAVGVFPAPDSYNAGRVQKALLVEFNEYADHVMSWLTSASVPAASAGTILGDLARIQLFLRLWWTFRLAGEIVGLGDDLVAAGAPHSLLVQLSHIAVDMNTAGVIRLTTTSSPPEISPIGKSPYLDPVPPWMPPVSILGALAPPTPVFWFGF